MASYSSSIFFPKKSDCRGGGGRLKWGTPDGMSYRAQQVMPNRSVRHVLSLKRHFCFAGSSSHQVYLNPFFHDRIPVLRTNCLKLDCCCIYFSFLTLRLVLNGFISAHCSPVLRANSSRRICVVCPPNGTAVFPIDRTCTFLFCHTNWGCIVVVRAFHQNKAWCVPLRVPARLVFLLPVETVCRRLRRKFRRTCRGGQSPKESRSNASTARCTW